MLTFSRMTGAVVSTVALASLASPAVGVAGAQLPSSAGVQVSTGAPGPASVAIAAAAGPIDATPGVPAPVSATLAQLRAALGGASPPSSAQAAALLRALANTPGLPAQAATALNTLADTVAAGSVPSASDLTGAVSRVIDQLAATPGLPGPVSSELSQLAAALGSPSAPTSGKVAQALRRLAGSAGVPSQAASAMNGLADAVAGPSGSAGSNGGAGAAGSGGAGGSGGANGSSGIVGFIGSNPFGPGFNPAGPLASGAKDSRAVRAAGIVIKSVRYNARRRTVAVVVQCNARGKGCNTAVAVYKGGTRTGRPLARTIAAQRRATFTMPVMKATAAVIARRGGVLRAVAVSNTPFGRSHSAKSVTIKRARHK